MKKTKKSIMLAVIIAIAAGLITGCSSEKEEKNTTSNLSSNLSAISESSVETQEVTTHDTANTDSTTQAIDTEAENTAEQADASQDNPSTEENTPQGDIKISPTIAEYMKLTRESAWGGVYPEYDMDLRMYLYEVTVNDSPITIWFGYEDDPNLGRVPSETPFYIECPIQTALSGAYNVSTYYDLKMLLGDNLKYTVEEVMGNMEKKLSATIDGHEVVFLSVINDNSFELTPDTEITMCYIYCYSY